MYCTKENKESAKKQTLVIVKVSLSLFYFLLLTRYYSVVVLRLAFLHSLFFILYSRFFLPSFTILIMQMTIHVNGLGESEHRVGMNTGRSEWHYSVNAILQMISHQRQALHRIPSQLSSSIFR